ncbi:DGQHR domain-containing protein [Arsenicibacter rosenii]|uniref:DGQHR domain-containing protein n=1 Tax=Arsenicibacter rosenii TaxID=1750698 RepID=A0A1S2VIQ9_9BACT|nr:DGQHR domain-containing protein [Arsenicibacter rosenii]OIN58632.1 hypothetical protein BLX24_13780 [Arsenicibacter rosenii]
MTRPVTKKTKANAKSNTKKVKLNATDLEKRKRQGRLHRSLMSMFKNMGFEYLKTEGKHLTFDGQTGEFDGIYIYENILLIVEETISNFSTDHIRKKDYYYGKVKENVGTLIEYLKDKFKANFAKYDDYNVSQYRLFYVYASDNFINTALRDNFKSLVFFDHTTIAYFSNLASTIKHTARFDLFKCLNLELNDIGNPGSSQAVSRIETAVILPETASGFPDGVQVVTFVMKAKELMECAYVLRKDSWDASAGPYQRLLDKRKTENIRKFLAKEKRTFIDSIIVSLPFDIKFVAKNEDSNDETEINIFQTYQFKNATMMIPYKINSIGVIDGQHRIYSHHEGEDTLEKEIGKLRNKRHLFVTGLCFDKDKFNDINKRKIESEIFLQINKEQKKVKPDLIQHIQAMNNPYSADGISFNVINNLNNNRPFDGLFSNSELIKGGLKTPSISTFGLRKLVAIDKTQTTLYKYYIGRGNSEINNNDTELGKYIEYCSKELSEYFCAIKDKYKDEWQMKTKKGGVISTTLVVGFLRSYIYMLDKYNGPQDFRFYQSRLQHLKINVNSFVSSQWNSLANEINSACWV